MTFMFSLMLRASRSNDGSPAGHAPEEELTKGSGMLVESHSATLNFLNNLEHKSPWNNVTPTSLL